MPLHFGWRSIALSLAALTPVALADICQTLAAGGIDIEYPVSISYAADLTNYWSAACGDLKPKCIAAPSSAAEMSQVIQELHNVDTLFAVKSGGHMPNNGFASIQDGLLVSTKNLDQVFYIPEDQTAKIGPGLSWEEAQKGLDGTGRAVVGGRLGGVGIGGYILGGGMSFLSTQYGWAANNVVNYEVVLANGTVVNASEKENTDLFAALKGGGNNFGIVTSYTMQTHPIGKVWGGNYVFTADKTPKLLEAVRNFVDNYPDDKAAIILTAEHGLLLNTWIMFLFYDGPEPPAGVFDEFTAIGHTSTTKTWDSYYDLLKHNDFFILHGQRYSIATETTPVPNSTVGVGPIQDIYDHWFEVSKSVLEVTGLIASIAFQPVPKSFSEKAKARGGDLLNVPTDTNYIFVELDYSWSLALDDAKIDQANQQLYQGMDNFIQSNVDKGLLPDVYRPLFMNDAYFRQDYWGRIDPASKASALQARLRYDPEGFFQKRTSGGWRLN
ncbi:FAD-linked oxidoreductase [Penicillium diatomitis]|uniref:FAD-linked oxidoreductase n=1 Tax=Penicillium diatomitis TaxID=2819901 RepID=A0A9W9X2C6_9EURO|nr:FAD-linked oxidoreductase [Penicillium diatomitis]KAJ5481125.1 FAD-linked oxidoreductase [Penicillium diatomitis]